MAIEGVLLTGGRGERMGMDKSTILVCGLPTGERAARELARFCPLLTVLGRLPINGYGFLEDAEPFAGPLAALARYQPAEDLVFVASCDMPLFSSDVVKALEGLIGDADAAIPVLEGRPQSLCALYRAKVFAAFAEAFDRGERSIQRAFSGLTVCFVSEEDLSSAGIAPITIKGANTPEEFEALTRTFLSEPS